jgi:hypothetical protein
MSVIEPLLKSVEADTGALAISTTTTLNILQAAPFENESIYYPPTVTVEKKPQATKPSE